MNEGLNDAEINEIEDYMEYVGLKEGKIKALIKPKEVDEHKKLENFMEIARVQKNFEIELYWKRAVYFWGFIVAIYTAFFSVVGMNKDGSIKSAILSMLSFLGFIFCLGFYFSNKGSKQWQKNWEWHVSMLERIDGGGLYNFFKQDTSLNFSVSKINDFLCYILSIASSIIFIICFYEMCIKIKLELFISIECLYALLGIIIIIGFYLGFRYCLRGNQADESVKKYKFYKIENKADPQKR